MTMTPEDLSRVHKKVNPNPVQEEFSVSFDSHKNEVTLRVNGIVRTYIKSKFAEKIFDKMLKIAKYKFIKLRERFNTN